MTTPTKQNSTCTLQLKQRQTEDEFNVAIIDTVDEIFFSFCNIDKDAFYRHLEDTFKIKKQEIPFKIAGFADAIEQIFGVGAKLIEIRIIETLHKRIPEFVFFPKKGDVCFKEYMASLHAFWLQIL